MLMMKLQQEQINALKEPDDYFYDCDDVEEDPLWKWWTSNPALKEPDDYFYDCVDVEEDPLWKWWTSNPIPSSKFYPASPRKKGFKKIQIYKIESGLQLFGYFGCVVTCQHGPVKKCKKFKRPRTPVRIQYNTSSDSELEINKPTKKPMTQEEKDHRKKMTDLKKAHIKKFIIDMGGEDNVTEKQIKEEKNKYDKQRRDAKKTEDDDDVPGDDESTKAEDDDDEPKKTEPKKTETEPKAETKKKTEPKAETKKKTEPVAESDDDFTVELEEEPVVKKVKKTKKCRKTTDTSSDSE